MEAVGKLIWISAHGGVNEEMKPSEGIEGLTPTGTTFVPLGTEVCTYTHPGDTLSKFEILEAYRAQGSATLQRFSGTYMYGMRFKPEDPAERRSFARSLFKLSPHNGNDIRFLKTETSLCADPEKCGKSHRCADRYLCDGGNSCGFEHTCGGLLQKYKGYSIHLLTCRGSDQRVKKMYGDVKDRLSKSGIIDQFASLNHRARTVFIQRMRAGTPDQRMNIDLLMGSWEGIAYGMNDKFIAFEKKHGTTGDFARYWMFLRMPSITDCSVEIRRTYIDKERLDSCERGRTRVENLLPLDGKDLADVLDGIDPAELSWLSKIDLKLDLNIMSKYRTYKSIEDKSISVTDVESAYNEYFTNLANWLQDGRAHPNFVSDVDAELKKLRGSGEGDLVEAFKAFEKSHHYGIMDAYNHARSKEQRKDEPPSSITAADVWMPPDLSQFVALGQIFFIRNEGENFLYPSQFMPMDNYSGLVGVVPSWVGDLVPGTVTAVDGGYTFTLIGLSEADRHAYGDYLPATSEIFAPYGIYFAFSAG